jgi:hypothetical protein
MGHDAKSASWPLTYLFNVLVLSIVNGETDMDRFGIDMRINRPFIERLRHDPRMKAMVDGWTAQATIEAEARLRHPDDYRRAMHEAARTGIALVLSFILDNDGEYRAVCEERDRLIEQVLRAAMLTPPSFVVSKDDLDPERYRK